MRTLLTKPLILAAVASMALAACSPKYNWRDFSSEDAPFRAMFPDKPASHTRAIDLAGMKVNMTMTAAQIDNTTFAVGAAEAPDAERAEAALGAMKTALINNIGATVTSEKAARASSTANAAKARSAAIDIEAKGKRNGVPMRLVGHFESRDKRFYQVIVMGPEKDMSKENIDMFLSSFKLQ